MCVGSVRGNALVCLFAASSNADTSVSQAWLISEFISLPLWSRMALFSQSTPLQGPSSSCPLSRHLSKYNMPLFSAYLRSTHSRNALRPFIQSTQQFSSTPLLRLLMDASEIVCHFLATCYIPLHESYSFRSYSYQSYSSSAPLLTRKG